VRIGFSGGDGITPGYFIFGGTSEASPEFAGVVSIADQLAHRRLGRINPTLYRLVARRAPGIVDVTKGHNTATFTQNGQAFTVKGFPAVRGYDLSTGWGTVDAARFVPELARGTDRHVRRECAAAGSPYRLRRHHVGRLRPGSLGTPA